jgi:O-antigen/teichoic acid export membrane protein
MHNLKPSRLIERFKTDTLFQNAVYLMLSTAVQAVLGLGFWLLNARLFSAAQIGLASALISASTFIAYLSLLGFNSTFIRFLPTSKRRTDSINTGLFLVLLLSTIIACVYLWLVPLMAPQLAFTTADLILAVGFVALSAAAATNLLTDSVFIAYRASRFNLLIYTVQSLVKLGLPLALVGLGAYGIFAASGLAAVAALGLSLYFMIRVFGYRPRPRVSRAIIAQVWHFSSASYAANLFNIIPTMVLPIIIVDRLGAAAAGYYYLAFMLANLVYAVAYSVSQSLFAEGSYGEEKFRHLLLRAAGLLAVIMVPAALGLVLLGPWILNLVGHSYGSQALGLIVMLALSAPVVAASVLGGITLRIMHRQGALVVTNAVYAVVVCGLAFVWASKGLAWVGAAWLAGNLVTAGMSFAVLGFDRWRKARS